MIWKKANVESTSCGNQQKACLVVWSSGVDLLRCLDFGNGSATKFRNFIAIISYTLKRCSKNVVNSVDMSSLRAL